MVCCFLLLGLLNPETGKTADHFGAPLPSFSKAYLPAKPNGLTDIAARTVTIL